MPCPTWDLPRSEIKPMSPALAGGFLPTAPPGKSPVEPFENICFVPRGRGFLGGDSGGESACQCRRYKSCRFDPWVRKIPWRRPWRPTLVFLPGKSHGQRSLVGYGPWGCRVRHDSSDLAFTHKAKAKFPFLTEFSVDLHVALCSQQLTNS